MCSRLWFNLVAPSPRRKVWGGVAVLGLLVAYLLPSAVSAQTPAFSSIHLAHNFLKPGQSQVLTVVARDLAGSPLQGASVVATVHYGLTVRTYHLPRTGIHGRTYLKFQVPKSVTAANRAVITVSITRGFLNISLSGNFSLSITGAASINPPAVQGGIFLVITVLPPSVVAPNPSWVAVYARTRTGAPVSGASVGATTSFVEGKRHISGTTDASGVSTMRLKTDRVKVDQTVGVVVDATWHNLHGLAATQFSVAAAPPVATSTPTPSPTPTATPVPVFAPTPTPTATAAPTISIGTAPTATPTPSSTDTPTPTSTATSTPTSTETPTPTDTLVPTPTSTPYPTAVPPPCPGTYNGHDGCIDAMLNMLNNDRAQYAAQYHVSEPPLRLSMTQSLGTSSCPGAYGHSVAMEQAGYIFHPANLPAEFCVPWGYIEENVGQAGGQGELQDLQTIDNLMLNGPGEQHDPAYCTSIFPNTNHGCDIMSTRVSSVGIGVYYVNGGAWLTEDFFS